MDFNFLFALILGLFPYFLVVTFLGSFKIAMIVGIIGGLIGGYGFGMFWGASGDNYE